MRKASVIAAAAATLALAGCATTREYTPMEKHLNRAAGAEVAVTQCGAQGGYASVAQMRSDAQSNLAQARELGATETDVQEARSRLQGQYFGAAVLAGNYQACQTLINSLAWAGDAPA